MKTIKATFFFIIASCSQQTTDADQGTLMIAQRSSTEAESSLFGTARTP